MDQKSSNTPQMLPVGSMSPTNDEGEELGTALDASTENIVKEKDEDSKDADAGGSNDIDQDKKDTIGDQDNNDAEEDDDMDMEEVEKVQRSGYRVSVKDIEGKKRSGGVNRKGLVVALQFLVVFSVVGTYLGYKIWQLSDKNINRNEYIIDTPVDAMPIPYVYIDMYSNDSVDTNCEFLVVAAITDDYSTYGYWSTLWGGYPSPIINDTSTTIESILEQTKYDGGIIRSYLGFYTQWVFIPPSNWTIKVDNKYTIDVYLTCLPNSRYENVSNYAKIDHIDQLNRYSTIGDFLLEDYFDASFYETNYQTRYSYMWHTFKNTVDKSKDIPDDEKYDYVELSVDGTYTSDDLIVELVIEPNTAGTKTWHITEPLEDFLDVLSSTGGIFATVNSFCALIAIYVIWGFEMGPLKFNGVSIVTQIYHKNKKHQDA